MDPSSTWFLKTHTSFLFSTAPCGRFEKKRIILPSYIPGLFHKLTCTMIPPGNWTNQEEMSWMCFFFVAFAQVLNMWFGVPQKFPAPATVNPTAMSRDPWPFRWVGSWEVFPKIGGESPPKWMVKIVEKPKKHHDLGENTTIFRNTHVSWGNEYFIIFLEMFFWENMEVVCPRRVGFRLELLGHMGSFSSILLNAESLREKVTDMSWDVSHVYKIFMWVFPKIWETPPNHPFVHRVWNHYNPSILVVFPIFGNTHVPPGQCTHHSVILVDLAVSWRLNYDFSLG